MYIQKKLYEHGEILLFLLCIYMFIHTHEL